MNHLGTVTLTTERLILRRFDRADAEQMYTNWATDEKVTKYVPWEVHSSVAETKETIAAWIANYEKDDTYNWVVALKETGELIGSILIPRKNELQQTGEVGYNYGSKYW